MKQIIDTGGEHAKHAHKLTSEFNFSHRGKRAQDTTLLLLALTLYCLTGTAFAGSSAQLECEIRGVLTHTGFSSDGKAVTESKYSYSVWLRDEEWLIRLTPATNNVFTAGYQYMEFGTDRTNSYRLDVFGERDKGLGHGDPRALELIKQKLATMSEAELPEAARQMKRKLEGKYRPPKQKSVNEATGAVDPVKYPDPGVNGHPTLLWLAYCSLGQIGEKAPRELPQVWGYEHPLDNVTNIIRPVEVKPHAGAVKGWESVTFLSTGREREPLSGTNETYVTLPSPFDRGYTKAEYQVLSYTNLSGFAIPLSFKLQRFLPKRGAKSASDTWVREKIEARTLAIAPHCGLSDFRPQIPAPTSISDQRLGEQYLAQPGPWPKSTNIVELTKHQNQVIASVIRKTRLRSRSVIAGIILLMTVPAVAIVFRRRTQ